MARTTYSQSHLLVLGSVHVREIDSSMSKRFGASIIPGPVSVKSELVHASFAMKRSEDPTRCGQSNPHRRKIKSSKIHRVQVRRSLRALLGVIWCDLETQSNAETCYEQSNYESLSNWEPNNDSERKLKRNILQHVMSKFDRYIDRLEVCPVNAAIWTSFMADCMWAAIWLSEKEETHRRVAMNHQLSKTQTLIEAVQARLRDLDAN